MCIRDRHREVVAQAEIEDVKRRKIKTPLQRVVQLLKRHRDIMFKDDQSGNKPISIIITTIAASLYNEEDNIYDAMKNILLNANKWIEAVSYTHLRWERGEGRWE